MIIKIVVLIIMILCAAVDIILRKIPVYPIWGASIAGVVLAVFMKEDQIVSHLLGAFIGIIIYIVGCLTKEKIGKGDGILLVMTGIYLGFSNNIKLLMGGLFLTFFYFLIMLCFGKNVAKKSVPFVPFLLASFVLFVL